LFSALRKALDEELPVILEKISTSIDYYEEKITALEGRVQIRMD